MSDTTRKRPAKPVTDDSVSRAIRLLAWARKNGFRVGPMLVVGDLTVQIEDIRQAKIESREEIVPEGDIYEGTGAEDEPAEGT